MDQEEYQEKFYINHPAGKLGKELTEGLDLMKPASRLNPLLRTSSLCEVITELQEDQLAVAYKEKIKIAN